MLWEAMGAVIGAGFASGAEIAVFFSRSGRWSWLGVAAAMLASLGLIGRIRALGGAAFRLPCWRIAFGLLAMVSGGAMTAAAGEIAALTLPVHGARAVGMLGAMAAAHLCVRRNTALFRRLCQGLTVLLAALLLLCLGLPPQPAAVMGEARGPAAAILCGVCWAGFNLALAAPLLTRSGASARMLPLLLGALLALGNAVLLRHPAAMHAALPLVQLTARFGQAGYALCCASLLLAEVSTLAAALGTLEQLLPRQARWAGTAGIMLIALAGFGPVVGRLYPTLGAVCTVLMLLPKVGTSHRAKNML